MDNNELFDKDEEKLLDIYDSNYIKKERLSKRDIFSGYKKLYAMTYSIDIHFLSEIMKHFEEAEVILGSERVLGNEIINIFAVDKFTIEILKPYLTKKDSIIYEMYYNKKLKLYISNKLSHGKLYLLENEEKNRVICGSSNMTMKGFSGSQNEINIKYDNNTDCFNEFKNLFLNTVSNSSVTRPIIEDCVKYDKEEIKIEDLPISKLIQTNKLFVNDISESIEDKTETDMLYDINRTKIELDKYISNEDFQKKDGKTIITYDDIIRIKNRQIVIEENQVKEGRKLNNLEFDFIGDNIYINGESVLGKYDEEKVFNDINILKEYFEGFEKYEFYGNRYQLKENYYKLLNYMFVSPFMCYFRNIYLKRGDSNKAEDGYSLFALLYGSHSGTGKSSVVRFILKMMYKKNNEVPKTYFTESNIRDLRVNYKGLPIYIDDLDKTRFQANSDKIIKDSVFGKNDNIENYPVCIVTLNQVGSVSEYIKRRAVMIRVEGKHNQKHRLTGIADKLQKKVTNNFYLKYLSIIFPLIKEKIELCKRDIENNEVIDLYELSSKILYDLLKEHDCNFLKELKYVNYFSPEEISKTAIQDLIDEYKINKKRFIKHKKIDILFYENEAPEYINKQIAEELPDYYEVKYDKYGIKMKYNKVKQDFKRFGNINI